MVACSGCCVLLSYVVEDRLSLLCIALFSISKSLVPRCSARAGFLYIIFSVLVKNMFLESHFY